MSFLLTISVTLCVNAPFSKTKHTRTMAVEKVIVRDVKNPSMLGQDEPARANRIFGLNFAFYMLRFDRTGTNPI